MVVSTTHTSNIISSVAANLPGNSVVSVREGTDPLLGTLEGWNVIARNSKPEVSRLYPAIRLSCQLPSRSRIVYFQNGLSTWGLHVAIVGIPKDLQTPYSASKIYTDSNVEGWGKTFHKSVPQMNGTRIRAASLTDERSTSYSIAPSVSVVNYASLTFNSTLIGQVFGRSWGMVKVGLKCALTRVMGAP